MYQFRIVFYGKFRRPLSVVNVRADDDETAMNEAQNHMVKGVKGYIMQKRKV